MFLVFFACQENDPFYFIQKFCKFKSVEKYAWQVLFSAVLVSYVLIC